MIFIGLIWVYIIVWIAYLLGTNAQSQRLDYRLLIFGLISINIGIGIISRSPLFYFPRTSLHSNGALTSRTDLTTFTAEQTLTGVERMRVQPQGYSWLFYQYLNEADLIVADEVDPYIGDVHAACQYVTGVGNSEASVILVYQSAAMSRKDAIEQLRFCLPHEVGHAIDNDLHESSKISFRRAIEETLALEPDEDAPWFEAVEAIHKFPGINGNDLDFGWGGWEELYAELFQYRLGELPPPLQPMMRAYVPLTTSKTSKK